MITVSYRLESRSRPHLQANNMKVVTFVLLISAILTAAKPHKKKGGSKSSNNNSSTIGNNTTSANESSTSNIAFILNTTHSGNPLNSSVLQNLAPATSTNLSSTDFNLPVAVLLNSSSPTINVVGTYFPKTNPPVEAEESTFFDKLSVGLIFAIIPFVVVFSFKNICPDFDRSMNMRRTGHKFSKLSTSEEEADTVPRSVDHTAADDWDEFLGDRNPAVSLGTATTAPGRYVSFIGTGSPPNEVETV